MAGIMHVVRDGVWRWPVDKREVRCVVNYECMVVWWEVECLQVLMSYFDVRLVV